MKKANKYLIVFLGFYNLFIAAIAAFNIFNFSTIELRILLFYTAIRIAIYKFTEYRRKNNEQEKFFNEKNQ